ncbi:hypothetical protein [Zavarzinella formosa]|uniref:hypothetical protein n=1 Tax=Zavarzinella formosa TaxID=360055 RepID=UPI0012F8EC37|nr:hypothetical protein [Zavarzinella formosa]
MTQQLNQLSGDLEEAYESAVKLCRKTGRDKLAAEIEKELEAIWAMKWRHIDYKDAGKLKDGHISLTVKEGTIRTKVVYSGPIEITVTARTEDENIRINAYNGSVIIFNWELNKSEFRVARPTGTPDKLESGSHLGVKTVPLEPNKWHTFRWRITSKGMEVYDNGRLVWSERRAYPVENMKGPIIMRRMNSAVDVEEIQVRQLDDAD